MSKWIDASLQERTVMLQQVADCKGIVDNLQEGVTETTIYLEQFFFPTCDDRRSYMILLGKYGKWFPLLECFNGYFGLKDRIKQT